MFELNPNGSNAQAGQGNPSDSPFPLDGKELIARAFVNAMMSVSNPMRGDLDLTEEVWKNIDELTSRKLAGLEPSPWLCINVETGELGRAYPFRGEYRIVGQSTTSTDLKESQKRRIDERNG